MTSKEQEHRIILDPTVIPPQDPIWNGNKVFYAWASYDPLTLKFDFDKTREGGFIINTQEEFPAW